MLLAARSGQSEYDVIQYDSQMMAALVAAGALSPLDHRISATRTYDTTDFPAAVNNYGRYQGKAYGLPLSTSPYVLWYRTDLFRKLGLSRPATYADYLHNAQRLSRAGFFGSDNGYGDALGAVYWLETVYNFGGRLLDLNQCKSLIKTPAVRAATEMSAKLLSYTPKSAISGGGNEMNAAFIHKDVGQMINGVGYYPIMADKSQSDVVGKVQAAVPPIGSNTSDYRTLLFGWLIGIPAHAEHPDLAWRFLMHALDKDSAKEYARKGAPPPARRSLMTDPQVVDKAPYLPVMQKALAHAEHLPYTPAMPKILGQLSHEVSALATRQKTVDQFLTTVDSIVTSSLANPNACP
jgi:multiple sugar transport system substrate-binding protein